MRRRTRDENFLNCPICGKKPYIKLEDADSAICYCRGRLFHRHVLLCEKAYRLNSYYNLSSIKQDSLYEGLMTGWNKLEQLKSFKETEERKWPFL